jgi:hypothetical protein
VFVPDLVLVVELVFVLPGLLMIAVIELVPLEPDMLAV